MLSYAIVESSTRHVHAAKSLASPGQMDADIRSRMVALPGGTFLMDTDFVEGFPGDGEGPVRPVALRSFSIDRYPVPNRIFRQFVETTGTDAECYGWSFVFWLHIPRAKFSQMVEDRVLATPWW